jgi:hypothetical protein
MKKLLIQLKLENGCLICGFNQSSHVLEYHHVNKLDENGNKNKKFRLSNIGGKTTEEIIEEYLKCVVLCHNHHSLVTSSIYKITLENNVLSWTGPHVENKRIKFAIKLKEKFIQYKGVCVWIAELMNI